MKFYYRYVATYHNNTRIGCSIGKMLTNEEPQPETHFLSWDNLEEMYKTFGMACKFNIWNFKKGRRVSFFTDSFFPKADELDVKEWKHPALNIRLEVSYREFTPSISEVLKWHDAEQAIQYLLEIGWVKRILGVDKPPNLWYNVNTTKRKEMIKMKERIVKIWEEHSVGVAIILSICAVAGYLVGHFGVMCLQSWLVMLLWNWVAVDLFSAPVLGFWMAFGLRWLCSLLFKSKVTANKKSE